MIGIDINQCWQKALNFIKSCYFIIIIITVCFFIILNRMPLSSDPTANYYILSSISQGLAALLAIVFTVALITMQIFNKFKAWKVIASGQTIILIIIFGIGIALPLITLRYKATSFLINLNSTIAFFCIFSLIPYLLKFGKFISSPAVYGELEEHIFSACNIHSWGQATSYLDDFKNMWLEKIRINDKNSWNESLAIWKNITVRLRESTRLFPTFFKIATLVTHSYVKKNEDYALKVYETFKLDSNNNLLPPLKRAAIDDNDVYKSYVKESLDIFETAFHNKFNDLSQDVVKTLGKLALLKNDKQIINELYEIDNIFVINVLKNNIMLSYLNGDQNIFDRLAKWLEEIDVKRSDSKTD